MVNTSFEYQVKEFAKSLGADLVGIALTNSKYLDDNKAGMEAILPGCKSLVVIAKRLNDDAIASRNIKISQYDTICTYQELDLIMHKVTSYLKENGHKAVSMPPNMPVDFSPEKRGMYGEVNQKCAATAAGLGNIGINRLFLSPEFGPFLRLGSVLTDADLRPDEPLKEKVCIKCMECVKKCPAGAIGEDGSLDLGKCMRISLKYGVPGVVKFGMKAISLKDDELRAHVGNPTLWELWQNLLIGNFNNCFECINACPVGKNRTLEGML
ncbi:MAG: 4Fe-4S binding protein [Methanotrichaceae archaeon]